MRNSILVISIVLAITGCSNAKKGALSIGLVKGDCEFYSVATGAQEHNDNEVVVDIDPGLVAKELPKINLSGSASIGWDSVHIKEIDGKLSIIRLADHVQVKDLPSVLRDMPVMFVQQQEE